MNDTLTDQIRELCAKVVNAPEPELEPVLADLRLALQKHTRQLRELAALKLVPINRTSPK
jgi:hypothetical protein